MKFFFVIFFLLISLSLFADDIATVKIIRGDVLIKLPNGESKTATIGLSFPEESTVTTLANSYVKLIYIDNSEMTLAPNSVIKIENFNKTESGIIHLVKGILRAKVTKDYMDMEDKSRSKLFIKTNYTALGIRGTYFQVEYNEQTEATQLHMFEGKVAFNKIDVGTKIKDLKQVELDRILNRSNRVIVEKGFQANINRKDDRPLPPREFNIKELQKNNMNLNRDANQSHNISPINDDKNRPEINSQSKDPEMRKDRIQSNRPSLNERQDRPMGPRPNMQREDNRPMGGRPPERK